MSVRILLVVQDCRILPVMTEHQRLTEAFEAERPRLTAIAHRILGSMADAEDAVQETWLRAHAADTRAVANLGAWLVTVLRRVSIDLARSRTSRREDPLGAPHAERPSAAAGPDEQAVEAAAVADAVSALARLSGPERLAFVLHDVYAVPFDEIGPLVHRRPAATRQLASRARRRLRAA